MMFSEGMSCGEEDLRLDEGKGAVTRRLVGREGERRDSKGRERRVGGLAGLLTSVWMKGCADGLGVGEGRGMGDSLAMGADVRDFFDISGSADGAGRFGSLSLSSSGLSRVKYRSFHCSGATFMDTCYNKKVFWGVQLEQLAPRIQDPLDPLRVV